jgi:signal transduction histidine kinase
LRALIGRSLDEVRLTQGIQNREPFLASDFIDEIAPAAMLAAGAQGITLSLIPVEAGVEIEADRQVLTAVIMNVLQNAFKFTRPRTTVTLRVGASAERVVFEVQDECGGLADGDVNELFHAFEQRGTNRTGAGLGLAFSRWGVEANHGRIYARSLPGVGCVFTVDLPRVTAALHTNVDLIPA